MNWRLLGVVLVAVVTLVWGAVWLTRPKAPVVPAPVERAKTPVDSRRYGTQISVQLAHARELDICRRQSQCDAGLLCARAASTGAVGCYGSTCSGPFDVACGPGHRCLALGGLEGDPVVYRCVNEGLVARGGRCVTVRSQVSNRCAGGLACVGGVCLSACDAAGSCEDGERCGSLAGLSLCLPTGVACENDADCPEDHTCGPAKFCVHPAAPAQSCLPERCAAGQACAGAIDGALVYGECRADCSASKRCPGAEVCVPSGLSAAWVCEPRCEVQADCRAGTVCRVRSNEARHCTAGPPLDAAEDEAAFKGPPEGMPH